MRPAYLAVLTAGLLFGVAAQAADEPADWLATMSLAARAANYEGVLVYQGDEVLETFRVTHRFAEGSERERVQSMTGEVREVLKQNDKLTYLLPKDKRVTANRAATPKGLFRPLSPERLTQIASVYELQEMGKQRIAGRICRGIAIVPRDDFRYGYQVWADSETGVPLKLSLVTRDGKPLERMYFTDVRFPATIPDSAFEAAASLDETRESAETAADAIAQTHQQEPLADVSAISEASRAQFSELPPGFRVVRREVRVSPAGVREHLVLSDGLSAVSVYRVMRRSPEAAAAQRLDQMGPVNTYSRMVGKVQITVVGEAPRRTIKMIGDNFEAAAANLAMPAAAGETVAPR